MRVYAEQDGNLNLELEAPGTAAYVMTEAVTAGWNDVSFDVSGADATVNWNRIQLRPDADSSVPVQPATTKYYIDDVHFAQASIVQQPADPSTSAFLDGPTAAPDADPADVVSLFSNAYTSALNTVAETSWSDTWSVTEMAINNGNTVKKFDATVFAGFDVPGDVTVTGMDSVSISLYRTASSDFEIKMVDLDAGKDAFYYIPASQMPVDQWVTIDIPLSSFDLNSRDSGVPVPADHAVDQLILKPMGGIETFYMDDMYFSDAGLTDNTGDNPGGNTGGSGTVTTTDYDETVVKHNANAGDAV